jgi:hypothetical protein
MFRRECSYDVLKGQGMIYLGLHRQAKGGLECLVPECSMLPSAWLSSICC